MNFRAKKFHFKELKSVKFLNFPPKKIKILSENQDTKLNKNGKNPDFLHF